MKDEEIRQLGAIGYELWRSQLIDTAAESTRKRFDRMKHPQLGDLVIETSTSGFWIDNKRPKCHPHIGAANAVGILDRIVREPVQPWDDTDEPAPDEQVFYLRRLDGTGTFRWTNASMVTILPIEGWPRL